VKAARDVLTADQSITAIMGHESTGRGQALADRPLERDYDREIKPSLWQLMFAATKIVLASCAEQ